MKTYQYHKSFQLLSERGFTLVELTIAVLLALFVTGITYMSYIMQQRSYVSQEQVDEMQSSSMVSLALLARDISEAGFGIPPGDYYIDINNAKIDPTQDNTISVQDNVGENGSDILTIVSGHKRIGTVANDFDPLGHSLVVSDTPNADINKVFSTLNQWLPEKAKTRDAQQYGRHHISLLGISLLGITAIDNASKTLTVGEIRPPVHVSALAPIYLVEDVIYMIEKRMKGTEEIFELVRWSRSGMPTEKITLSENIEDMQVTISDDRSMVDIQLMAKTKGNDPIFENQGQKLTYDSGTDKWNPVGGTDSYRRRLITLSVAVGI